MTSEDEELIARFLEGEFDTIKVIDGWIARAAWPFQRRLAPQWDDVLQEIRLEVARLLGRRAFRGEASLKTYLWRIANHTCINHIRAQAKWKMVDLEAIETRASPADGLPLSQLLQKESGQILLRVLEEMSPECRELWQMVLSGLSYQEMSKRLSVSEGALRVRVLRCRKKAVAARDQLMGSNQEALL